MRKQLIIIALLCAVMLILCGSASAADTPSANFTSNVTNGSAPLSVQFNDTSSNTPTSWNWNFGDGNTSTEQNPVHNYTKAGTYNVSLTAGNDAGSNTTTKTNYITVQLNDVYVSTTGSDTAGDGTTGNPYATIQTGLNNVASGGTVHLASGTYTGTGNVGLTITKNVNIVGGGQASTTINAASSNTIFTISSGLNVTIANLTFTNGKSTNGGAIYNGGTLNMSGCTFSSNTATSMGGAVYNAGTLNVNNCTFSSNTVTTKGGAIYNAATSNVNNCTFSSNKALSNHGGAIFNQGTLNVNSSAFTGNTASINGGAIMSQGTLNVHFSSFVNNTATTGSTIYSSSGTANMQNNWWGSNNNPSNQINGNVNYSNWLYMTLTVNPGTITKGGTGTATVSFNNVCNGTTVTSIDPANGHIFDGTTVNFSSVLGSFSPVTAVTSNGIATSIFTASDTNIRPINATADNQTVSTYINGVGTAISVNNVTCISGSTVNLTATLTNVNGTGFSGQTVTFTVNGSSYDVTTDANGVAALSYTPNKAGVYSVIASFAGDSTYGDCSKTGYLTVQLNDVYVSPTGSDTTGDGTAANPYATIQTALNAVTNGGTIHLMSGTYTGTGNKGLNITKNVSIVGQGQKNTVIDAQKSGSIFTVNSGVTVTIANLTFANGTTTNSSVISNAGTLNASNCTFSGNTAVSGAAILNTGTLNANNCVFNGNAATSSGGAIYNTGTLNANNCVFNDNAASSYGGAIYNTGTLNVHFSSFVNNTAATGSGSAIYRSSGTVNVNSNWWGSNSNPSSQIYGTVTCSNWLYMTITVNPATIANGGTGTVTVSFNNVCNGTTVTSIDPASGHIVDGTIVNLSSVLGSFDPITALTSNGIATSTFTASDTHIRTINAVTDNQTVSTYLNGIGSAISVNNVTCTSGSTVNLTATLTSQNGTVLPGQTVTFTVNGSSYDVTTDANGVATLSYTPNKAGVYSVIASFAGDSTYGDCSKTGYLTVQANDVYVSPTGSDTTGDGTKNNPFATIQTGLNCVVSGGTIHLMAGTYTGTGNNGFNLTKNVNIVGENKATTIINAQKLSNVFTVNSGVTLTLANLAFVNGAATNGGAINNNGILSVSNCIFSGNTATSMGGAVYTYNGATAALNGCTFINNVANMSFGGAIYSYNDTVTLNGCTFINNTANSWGGAIINAWNGTLNMSTCTFTSNTVVAGTSNQGGAISNAGINAVLNVNNCVFNGNSAGYGGAIYNNGYVTVHFSSFVNNTATSGGAIYVNFATATVNAQNNWWGSNSNPSSQVYVANGTADCSNWLYMTLTVNPTIASGSSGTATVSFNNIWNGTAVVSIDPASGHIPDGTVVSFSSTSGSLDQVTAVTRNGIATSNFTAGNSNAVINATADNQTLLAGVNKIVTSLTTGNATGVTGKNISLNATLTDDSGNAISGKTVTFTVNGTSYNVTTDANGIATLNYTVTETAGTYTITASFTDSTYNYVGCTSGVSYLTVPLVVSNNVTGGCYNNSQTVALTTNDGNANIYYSVNGGALTKYDGPITIDSTSNLSYFAIDSISNLSSLIYAQNYVIDTKAPTVTVSENGGLYNSTQTVTLNAADDTNTTIYYTTDGSDPKTSSTRAVYDGAIIISNTTTLKYTAVDAAGNWAPVQTQTYTIDTVSPTVTANVPVGTYNTAQSVTITSDDPTVTIYYTTDGSDPTTSSTKIKYNGDVTISSTTTLKYSAVDAAGNWATVQIRTYIIDTSAPVVTANVTTGTYNAPQTVSLTAADDTGTIIYYTTDGTDPTTSSTIIKYNGAITIGSTTTLKYTAVDAAGNWATVQTQNYTIDDTAPFVSVNKTSGSYNTTQSVVLTSDDPAATIYYTTDGSDPTTSSTKIKYNGTITISSTTTLKYTAVDAVGNWAAVQAQTYKIDKTAPTASANVKTGTYNVNKVVTLTMSENGTIYYTLNGSTPTTASTKYTGSITISSTKTLKFIAVDAAGNKSPVYTATYTIDKTAPKVSAVSPTNGATGVSRTKTVSIRLSENVIKGVNWSKVYIKNMKTGQKCKATIWISGNHIYISTNSKKAALTWYQVYIPASAIKDSAGNNLAKAYTFKFKTGKT